MKKYSLLKDFFMLNDVRKSFLVIWVVILFFPSVFFVGMILEGQIVVNRVLVDNEWARNPRPMQWDDLFSPFFWMFFGTVALYCVVGLGYDEKGVKR